MVSLADLPPLLMLLLGPTLGLLLLLLLLMLLLLLLPGLGWMLKLGRRLGLRLGYSWP